MQLTERDLRSLAKQVGLSPESQQEIARILKEDDYSASFPFQGPVTYAIASLLLGIIRQTNLELKCLPIAISCVDKSVKQIGGNIKRTVERKVKTATSTSELFCRIESLYHEKSVMGPGCTVAKLDETWLQGEAPLPSGSMITNRSILELVRYLKHEDLPWSSARQWLIRIFPESDCDNLPLQTITTNWLKLQKRARQLRGKKHEEAYLQKVYTPPSRKLAEEELPSTSSTSGASPGRETVQDVSNLTIQDVLAKTYDSPTKTKLVKHIRQQDKLITQLHKKTEDYKDKLGQVNCKYTEVVNKYLVSKKERKSVAREFKELEKEERELRSVFKDRIVKESELNKVGKQIESKEKKIQSLQETVKQYREDMSKERREWLNRLRNVDEELQSAKCQKRKEQKRVWWYKNKANPLQEYKDKQIKDLLREVNSMSLQNDDLECQLQEAINQPSVSTFANGKYTDAIRLVVYDFLSRNVGTKHVSSLIASVLQNLGGLEFGRLPKETLVKLMALEADILSKKQVAKALMHSPNATLHMDATSKKQRHFYSIQVATDTESFSAGIVETVHGDTDSQVDVTKDFFKEMASVLETEAADGSNEYKLLFNIKNTMGDRGPTSRSWVDQLENWREEVLKKNLLPGYTDLSSDAINGLSKINDFYCGKHFLLGLAERTKAGLNLWEDEVAEITGRIGMEALPEFAKWNCQKPAGLRLIRTACELVGTGAKDPHGIPEDFKAHLNDDETNHIPYFEHNRFNIVFKAASAVYHHQAQLRDLLIAIGSENKLHRAVLEDIGNPIVLAEVKAIALLEKHITTPLATISSRKEHILDLRNYYRRLREFLQEIIRDPSSIVDGTAVLFEDCPPVKDEIWESLYKESPEVEEEEATLDQLISVLCASFFVVCERQLFDFLHGKWAAEQTMEMHKETASVARNNDISERDFSGLDRLLRSKSSANMDFIEGLILYVNNKTGQYLQTLSASELQNEIATAMKGARKRAKLNKEKKKKLREQRKEAVQKKQKRREELEKTRLQRQQKVQDEISMDGQVKSLQEMEVLIQNYTSVSDKRKALLRQVKFYKSLKIEGIPNVKYINTSQGRLLPLEQLTENLTFIITAWKAAMNNLQSPTEVDATPSTSTFQIPSANVNTLKRKLLEEAETERLKKAKKYHKITSKQTDKFPGLEIIGKRINHRYEIETAGKVVRKWFKGTVLRVLSDNELGGIGQEDEDMVNQGYTLFMVKYDNEEEIEPFALKWDWDNGDLKLL